MPPKRPTRRGRRWLALGAVVVALLLQLNAVVSWFFSEKLIAQQFPARQEMTFSDVGLPRPEPVAFANGETQLAGWYFANPRRAGCAVVRLHGFTGNKTGILKAAPLVWDRGGDLFAYNLRGHGESDGGLLTYGVRDKGTNSPRSTGSPGAPVWPMTGSG